MPSSPCPSRDELAALVAGELPAPAVEAVAAHLDCCPQCVSTVRGLEASPGPLLAGIRAAGAAPPAAPARLGQYELLDKLGQGGMGSVYRARHVLLKRIVAVKLLPPERLHDPSAVARFRREMEAVGRLQHPNIVAASDAGVADGAQFLVMELIDGTDLGQLVRRRGPLPVADACELVRMAAVGLQHVHENALVHRDVKPSNLMLTRAGQLKLLDLGLALLHGDALADGGLTGTGQVMGTVDYMAPEQAFDTHHVDIRADLYSLGCTLYFLLTGEPPFPAPGQSPLRKMAAHQQQPIPSVRARRPGVPPGLADVLARLLAKRPADRYATPAEAAGALAAFTAGRDLRALPLAGPNAPERAAAPGTAPELSSPLAETDPPRPPAPPPTGKPARARRRRSLVAGAVLLLAALAGAAAWFGPVIIRVATNKGQLTVKTVDESVEVKVKRGGDEVEVLDLKTRRKIDLPVGEYELELTKGAKGLGLRTNRFTLTRGGEAIAEVVWEPVASKGGGGKPPPADGGGKKPPAGPRKLGTWEPGPEERVLGGYISRPVKLPGVRRWNIASITPYRQIDALAWSPDSRLLACVSSYGDPYNLRVFDRHTGRPTLIAQIRGLYEPRTTDVVWSPDNRSLAILNTAGVCFWDVVEKRQLWSTGDSQAREWVLAGKALCLAWSPDGKRLASGHLTKKVCVLDPVTGKVEATFAEAQGEVTSIAWSPDGRWLAAGSKEGAVRLWDVPARKAGPVLPDHVAGHPFKGDTNKTSVHALAWEPGGTRLAYVAGGKALKVWDAVKGQEVQRLTVEGGEPVSVFWRTQSPHLAVLTREGRLWLWDAVAGKQVSAPADFLALKCAAWSPDGQWLANDYWLGSGGGCLGLEVWDVARWKRAPLSHAGDTVLMSKLAVDPAGDRFAMPCHDGLIRVFDVASGLPHRAGGVLRPAGEMKDRILNCVAWSPDGGRLVSGGSERHVRIWDAQTGKEVLRLEEAQAAWVWANDVAWSPDGSRIAVAAFGTANLRVWDSATGNLRWSTRGDDRAASLLSWSPDGKWLATSGEDSTVRLWTGNGQPHWRWRLPEVADFAWSPDGKLLATSSGDRTIRIWDPRTRREIDNSQLPGPDWHCGPNLGRSHDGKRSLIPREDGVHVVDSDDGKTIYVILCYAPGSASPTYVAWGRDDRTILTSRWDGSVHAWDGSTYEPLWVGIALPHGNTAVFSAAGELLHADPGAEDDLAYLVQDDNSRIDVLTAAEFAAKHGRKRGQ